MRKEIHGIIPAVITPFDDRDRIDEWAFRTIINFLIDNKVHGIFPAGSQGEFLAVTLVGKKR